MQTGNALRLGITAAVLTATLVASNLIDDRNPSELSAPLETIPLSIGCWEGRDNDPLSKTTEDVLKADDYITRSYDCENQGLSLFIAYYALQRAGESMHSPKHCLPGSGWEIWNYEELETTAPNGQKVPINKFYLQHGASRSVAFYWYQSRSRIIANEYLGKICLVWDTVLRGDTEGSIVRVTVPDEEWTDDLVDTFIPQLIGEVANVMPGESRFRPSSDLTD